MKRTNERAISATIRTFCARRVPVPEPLCAPPPFRVLFNDTRNAASTGANPNKIPVRSDTTSVNRRTRKLRCATCKCGMFCGAKRRIRRMAQGVDLHVLPLTLFLAHAAGTPWLPALPSVSFVDSNFGIFGIAHENDEHPPTDVQRGQTFVSTVVNALRQSPYWQDTMIFITYDEHGGYYDRVPSPAARQGFARTPDGISPGHARTSPIPAEPAARRGSGMQQEPAERNGHFREQRGRAVS